MSYKLITLTAGHNGIIPGASGNGYKEHVVAREIVAQLEKDFKAVGQKIAICTDEVGKTKASVWGNAVKNCNKHDKKGRLDVSVHLNAGGGTGVEVLYYNQKDLASKVSKAIADVTGYRNRGPKERKEIGFLKGTNAPSILLEVCFIDNKSDMDILKKKMKEISRAIVKSLTGKTVPTSTSTATSTSTTTTATSKKLKVLATELHTYKTANWNDKSGTIVKKGEVFTIAKTLTVNGSKMYQLKSGLYITANTKYVQVI